MDTINNMLTALRNGVMAEKSEISITPFSKVNHQILKLLKKEGYLDSVKKTKTEDEKGAIMVKPSYDKDDKAKINQIIPVSKPGRRIYKKAKDLEPYRPLAGYKQELGRVVISTSQGIMTSKQARKESLGGQILFKIN